MTDPICDTHAFARAILCDFPDLGNLDGGDIQELAEKHGLLVKERRHSWCSDECCGCREYHDDGDLKHGFDCFHVHPLLGGKGCGP
jgi:hypothetical protein